MAKSNERWWATCDDDFSGSIWFGARPKKVCGSYQSSRRTQFVDRCPTWFRVFVKPGQCIEIHRPTIRPKKKAKVK